MITPWTIYWLSRLDSIVTLAFCIAFFGVVLSLFLGYGAACTLGDDDKNDHKIVMKWLKRVMTATTVALLTTVFVPNTKEMAAILILPATANNQQVQDIGKEFGDLAKEWLHELKPKKEKTK